MVEGRLLCLVCLFSALTIAITFKFWHILSARYSFQIWYVCSFWASIFRCHKSYWPCDFELDLEILDESNQQNAVSQTHLDYCYPSCCCCCYLFQMPGVVHSALCVLSCLHNILHLALTVVSTLQEKYCLFVDCLPVLHIGSETVTCTCAHSLTCLTLCVSLSLVLSVSLSLSLCLCPSVCLSLILTLMLLLGGKKYFRLWMWGWCAVALSKLS